MPGSTLQGGLPQKAKPSDTTGLLRPAFHP